MPFGWTHWVNNGDLSREFMSILSAAQESASTIAECFLAASQIDPADPRSWHREWRGLGDANKHRAERALRSNHIPTAQSNLLRAINYYQAAAHPFDEIKDEVNATLLCAKQCVSDYLSILTPAGSVVDIPWLTGYPLQGYLIPVGGAQTSPFVIHIGDPGDRKEAYFYKMIRHARDRRLSLLVVDLLGLDAGARFERIVGRTDLETAVGSCVDYLEARDDVDLERIAVLGDRNGSSFVARATAMDPRIAAVVCDGGLWDQLERASLKNGTPQHHLTDALQIEGSSVSARIRCPVLITMCEHDWLHTEYVMNVIQQLKSTNPAVTFRIFSETETSASQAHCDNPALASEVIFDWIADRIGAGSARDQISDTTIR